MTTDLYAVLGADKTASQDELKAAYRRAAMKAHPDREGGSDEAFKAVQQAGDILLDPEKRAEYDKTGKVPGEGPSLQDRVEAMLDDLLEKLGSKGFEKSLQQVKEKLQPDKDGLVFSLCEHSTALQDFRAEIAKMKEAGKLPPPLARVALLREARLKKKVTDAEAMLDFMRGVEETLASIELPAAFPAVLEKSPWKDFGRGLNPSRN
jgi:curved DNA-binding protein CbpA